MANASRAYCTQFPRSNATSYIPNVTRHISNGISNWGRWGEQELLELKQLYVKATGEAYGSPADDSKANKKKKKTEEEKSKDGGGEGQPKHMDTRKADKARKVRSGDHYVDIFGVVSFLCRSYKAG